MAGRRRDRRTRDIAAVVWLQMTKSNSKSHKGKDYLLLPMTKESRGWVSDRAVSRCSKNSCFFPSVFSLLSLYSCRKCLPKISLCSSRLLSCALVYSLGGRGGGQQAPRISITTWCRQSRWLSSHQHGLTSFKSQLCGECGKDGRDGQWVSKMAVPCSCSWGSPEAPRPS